MINNKEIILKKKRHCKICGKARYDGIMIIKSFICEDCVNSITNEEFDDKQYEDMKNRIKYILF